MDQGAVDQGAGGQGAGGQGAGGQPTASDPRVWHRLHPLSPVLRLGRAVPILVVIGAEAAVKSRQDIAGHAVELIGVGLAVLASVVTWLVTRWRVEDGDLRIESGLLTRRSRRYPLARLQAVDIVRPLLGRILGLAELRLRIAGAGQSDAKLAYLSEAQADRLRLELLSLAAEARDEAPVGDPPGYPQPGYPQPAHPQPGYPVARPADPFVAPTGRGAGGELASSGPYALPAPEPAPLVSLPLGRLIGSVVVSTPTAVLVALVVALAICVLIAPQAAPGLVTGLASVVLGTAGVAWRRISGSFGFTLRPGPDGVQVSAGLLATRTESIPLRRIQGVRISEPLLWRPFGWCRVHVDVAGQRGRDRDEGGTRAADTLLPVGSRAEAARLLDLVLPGARPRPSRPPTRARWKSPLRFHNLAAGCTDEFVVTGSGRLTRVTDIVPLAKVQSLRRVQGPVQRRLGLASVHIDIAGRTVHPDLLDRDAGEADQTVDRISRLARAARVAG